jgi:trimethylamine--corrinoid protein Co-methyltransferase
VGRPALALDGDNYFFGTGSDCLNILDHRSGLRRAPTLDDVRDGITVIEALPNMDFAMSMFLPADVDPIMTDRRQMAVMLERTTKPLVCVTYDVDAMVDVIAMAEAVAGGAEALRQRPTLAQYVNVTRALVQNGDSLRKLMTLAAKGLPATWIPVTSGGTTGPVTTAGNVAITMAGVLAGLVLAQLVREGAPFILPGFAGQGLDMRTMVLAYSDPDQRITAPALAHHYGLPMFGLGGCSDSKVPDQQAAAEAALTMLTDALAGAHLIHDSGYLESGLTGSLAQLVICDEIAGWVRSALAPVVIDDETLALDMIDALGPDGSFLETDHTIRHYRERWYPGLFDRAGRSAWEKRGGSTLLERATARVDEILAGPGPTPLRDDVSAEIDEILARAATTARQSAPVA